MSERIKPKDFSTGAPPRIMGTEAEDHVSLRAYTLYDKLAEDEEAIDTLLSKQTFDRAGIMGDQDSDGWWLSNGQRMYKDCGEMLESCTAESLGPKKALAATLAGIKVLGKVADASELPIYIFRRSATVDNQGTVKTSGFHMNHITPEENTNHFYNEEYKNPIMQTHAATRLYTWGGMVGPEGYSLSQKALIHKYFYKYKETEFGYTRIEDYSGENSSPWGTFMAMATTSVLLRIPEHPEQRDLNKRFSALALKSPRGTMRTVLADTTLNEVHSLVGGRRLTAIEIQTELADIASEFGKRFKLPEDEQYAVDQWKIICRDLEKASEDGDLRPLASRIGWVSKKLALERKNVGPLKADNPEAVLFDMSWDCIYPREGGRLQYARRAGLMIATDEEVMDLVTNPPKDTRAAIRGKSLEDATLDGNPQDWSGFWSKDDQTGETEYTLLDPYQTSI